MGDDNGSESAQCAADAAAETVQLPTCIVDFSFYEGRGVHPNDWMIVKELAILVPETGQTANFVFRSPCAWTELSKRTRARNFRKRKAGLGFAWESGHVPYHELESIITETLHKFPVVICNGLEKAEFITNIIRRGVYDASGQFRATTEMRDYNVTVCLFHDDASREACPMWMCHVTSNYIFSKIVATTGCASDATVAELEWPPTFLNAVHGTGESTANTPVNANAVEESIEPSVTTPQPPGPSSPSAVDDTLPSADDGDEAKTISKRMICQYENAGDEDEPCASVRAVDQRFRRMSIADE